MIIVSIIAGRKVRNVSAIKFVFLLATMVTAGVLQAMNTFIAAANNTSNAASAATSNNVVANAPRT